MFPVASVACAAYHAARPGRVASGSTAGNTSHSVGASPIEAALDGYLRRWQRQDDIQHRAGPLSGVSAATMMAATLSYDLEYGATTGVGRAGGVVALSPSDSAPAAGFPFVGSPLARALSPQPVTGKPAKKSAEKPWAKTLIGGTCTVFFEAFGGGHFLEFLKIAKQTSEKSYGQIVKEVTQHKGIAGTLDGFLPWGAAQSITKGAVFSWGHATSKKFLAGNGVMSDGATEVLAGGMGGLVQGVFMSPLLLLKTRVMTDPAFRSSGGVVETTMSSARIGARVIGVEGAGALFKGVTVFSVKRFADWTTRYFFVQVVESIVKDHPDQQLSRPVQMMCALGGGTLSALSTVPIDVMVATIQQASKAGEKVSVVQVFKTSVAEGGAMGTVRMYTKGLVARVAHVALTTLLMKTVTSAVYDKLMR